jgi:two-component system CheB/CheR fusion protein
MTDDGKVVSEADEESDATFPIAGVGASAGGIEALEAFLGGLEVDSMAFVVVAHLGSEHESHLAQVLSHRARMPVETVTDGTRVQPNHVYVAPAGSEVAILNGVLHLIPIPPGRPRFPIDFFFRSLAEDRGALSLGVVLSGTGSDGTLGLKAIKAEAGITFAQDPATARFDAMPRTAIDGGFVDFILPPAGIAAELVSLANHPYVQRGQQRLTPADGLAKIFVLLRAAFGHDFSLYKLTTIERRIERRMALNKFERIEDYTAFLQERAEEVSVLYRDLLIGVTSFFRDKDPWENLKTSVLPRLVERRRANTPLRIWCAGCSSGEEAYTIAMVVLEFLESRGLDTRIQIFASDVDHAAVQYARRGIYSTDISLDVGTDRLQRFFVKRDGEYQVSRRIRDMIVFATQNIAKDPPFSRLDLVTCRNVLIYFQPPLQKKVLRIFHYSLVPDGALLLGTSESVGDSPDLFTLVDRKNKIYVKKNVPVAAPFEMTFGEGTPRSGDDAPPRPQENRSGPTLQQLADRKILERYGPAGVIITEHYEVLQFRGKTGPFLEPLPGTATLNLLKLARPELVGEIRTAVHRALDSGVAANATGLPLRQPDGSTAYVDLEVLPIQDPETKGRCFAVLFRSQATPRLAEDSRPNKPNAGGTDPRVLELERELAMTKEYLQSTIEELETANEELKSSNEELQSSNEELQSTNEELETSKEELQSANEELTTVNDELQSRMSELSEANDDLQNILQAIETPLVIVGNDLRIRRYTHAAETLLHLMPADIGRSVAHLASFALGVEFEEIAATVIDTITPRIEEITSVSGRVYRFKATPYKTAEHAIRGVVMTFREIGEPNN